MRNQQVLDFTLKARIKPVPEKAPDQPVPEKTYGFFMFLGLSAFASNDL